MSSEIYDYVSIVTPDYSTTTLDINPQAVIVEDGNFNQQVFEADDESEEIVTLSNNPIFYFNLQWNRISPTDSGKIFDFYFDVNKAKGFERSFKFENQSDGHTYVVRFRTELNRNIKNPIANNHSITKIKLKVIGRIAD